MAPSIDRPYVPPLAAITDNPVLREAVRRLMMIESYVLAGLYQTAAVDQQFHADVKHMALKGAWAPPLKVSR